jgi:ribosomal protein S8
MEVREGGTKVRIPQPIFDLIKQLLIRFGVSTCSFVEHLLNRSKNGVCRGDIDLYVLDAKQAEVIIEILTKLGFVKDFTDKSNPNTFRLYLDVLYHKFSDKEIMPLFNLLGGSNPAQYYIEVEIKIATEFQKAYESNCVGYFLGILLSHYFKISSSGISLKHGCAEIPLNVSSFDDFLKKLRINLDGIRTTEEFIERLLASPLISELLTVDNILRLYKNIMGDEKMKHTSKPLREWLHLLLCGLKERFPDQFSSLKSELVQEMVCDERNSQMIPVWRVQLFVSHLEVECEVQMERGVLSITVSGKKLFVSTVADDMSLILSEKQLKSDSGKQSLPESMKVCSRLFELFKENFDYLKDINSEKPIIEQFIRALGCRSEVGSHLGKVGLELMKKICEELMKPLYSVIRTQPASMSGPVYGKMMKEFRPVVIDFSQFKKFCVERLGLLGDYNDFVIQMMNRQIFRDYSSRIDALSPELSLEENKQKRGEIYDDAIRNIVKLCSELVEQWTLFHNSDENWRDEGIREFHIPSQTYPETSDSDLRPYYLGTSMFEGINVHVFMDGEFGQVFTMVIE